MPGLATMGGAAQAVVPATKQPFFTPERSRAFMGIGDILQGGTGQAFLPEPQMSPPTGAQMSPQMAPGQAPSFMQFPGLPSLPNQGGFLNQLMRMPRR